MIYFVNSDGSISTVTDVRPEQIALAHKRANVTPLRERCVLSLEAAQRIINEWIKERS